MEPKEVGPTRRDFTYQRRMMVAIAICWLSRTAMWGFKAPPGSLCQTTLRDYRSHAYHCAFIFAGPGFTELFYKDVDVVLQFMPLALCVLCTGMCRTPKKPPKKNRVNLLFLFFLGDATTGRTKRMEMTTKRICDRSGGSAHKNWRAGEVKSEKMWQREFWRDGRR